MRRLGLVLAASALSAQGALAQDRVVLEPSSDWVLNYDDDSCVLARQFGEEGEEVYLEMRQFGPSGMTQFVIASSNIRTRNGAVRYRFLPLDIEQREAEAFLVTSANGNRGKLFTEQSIADSGLLKEFRLNFLESAGQFTTQEKGMLRQVLTLDPLSRDVQSLLADETFQVAYGRFVALLNNSPEYIAVRDQQESLVESLIIESGFDKILVLPTGTLGAPMEAMNKCIDDLMTHWGVDAEAHRSLSRGVRPIDQMEWARRLQASYPRNMARAGSDGYLRVRLSVSAAGEVTGCNIQTDFADEEIEQVTCSSLRRNARFLPALDANGGPVDSFFLTTIAFSAD